MARILAFPFPRAAPGLVCRTGQRRSEPDSHTERTLQDHEVALSFPEAWRPFIVLP